MLAGLSEVERRQMPASQEIDKLYNCYIFIVFYSCVCFFSFLNGGTHVTRTYTGYNLLCAPFLAVFIFYLSSVRCLEFFYFQAKPPRAYINTPTAFAGFFLLVALHLFFASSFLQSTFFYNPLFLQSFFFNPFFLQSFFCYNPCFLQSLFFYNPFLFTILFFYNPFFFSIFFFLQAFFFTIIFCTSLFFAFYCCWGCFLSMAAPARPLLALHAGADAHSPPVDAVLARHHGGSPHLVRTTWFVCFVFFCCLELEPFYFLFNFMLRYDTPSKFFYLFYFVVCVFFVNLNIGTIPEYNC